MARRLLGIAAVLLLAAGCGYTTPENLTARGLRELRTGQYDQAIATCSKAIVESPQDAEAYLYRGRAFQFRNAMGDPGRAIEDFTEAIRLAPDSPDAFYSRAIVYRDQGQNDQADADDKEARATDELSHEAFNKLPTPPARTTVADASPEVPEEKPAAAAREASGELLPQSPFAQRELYEKLKERFEPAAGATESPIERYNRLSRQPLEEPTEDPLGSLGSFSSQPPLPPLAGQPQPGLSPNPIAPPGPPTLVPPNSSRLPGRETGQLGQPPQPQQSFRPLQSPFGTRRPSPTGFGTQPANRQSPRAVRQQPPPSGDIRYSNPAVRPPNPRDYVP